MGVVPSGKFTSVGNSAHQGSNSCMIDSKRMTANNLLENDTTQHSVRTTTVSRDCAPSIKSALRSRELKDFSFFFFFSCSFTVGITSSEEGAMAVGASIASVDAMLLLLQAGTRNDEISE